MSIRMVRSPLVHTSGNPQAPAVVAGGHFYCAAVSTDADGNIVGKGDIREQMRRSMDNVIHLLEAAGGGIKDIARIVVFLSDVRYIEGMNQVWREYFTADAEGDFPVRATVTSALGDPDLLVELDVVAFLDNA